MPPFRRNRNPAVKKRLSATRHLRPRIVKNPGTSPGTLIYTGNVPASPTRISLFDYTPDRLEERRIKNVEETFAVRDTDTVSWIDVIGLSDTSVIEKIGANFRIHPLVCEDIASTSQRPKLELFDDYLFLTLKMLTYGDQGIEVEQVSLIINKHFVISFQEKEGALFEPVRQRIRSGKGRIRRNGADYLMYALIDAVVDNYFLVLERLGERIAELETIVLEDPTPSVMHTIQELKHSLLIIRRSIWPLRDVLSNVVHADTDIIQESTEVFLKDVYDHTVQALDSVETYRDIVASMFDIYLSSVSNRMNQIMKVLTIISTIFIPLTFLAGVYGMNFEHMPELQWQYGYYGLWGVMLLIIIGMVLYFRKREWL